MGTQPSARIRQVLYAAGLVFVAAFILAYATGR
jgi:hypothetical protein